MARLMKLEVLTPEKLLVKREDISYVLLNTVNGGVGILANHGPMIAVLGEGALKLQDKDNQVILVYVEGGFAEVKDNQVVILTPEPKEQRKSMWPNISRSGTRPRPDWTIPTRLPTRPIRRRSFGGRKPGSGRRPWWERYSPIP